MTDKIVVLSTCASEADAERLAMRLLSDRLVACVTVIPQARSFYRWNGAIESSVECLLLMKSHRDRFEELRAALESAHSYEVPELLALPVFAGSPAYLAWMESSMDGSAA